MFQIDDKLIKRLYTLDDLKMFFEENSQIALYGAGELAHGVMEVLNANQYLKINAILVTDIRKNPDTIHGVRVYQYDDDKVVRQNLMVVIAVGHSYRYDVIEILQQTQFKNIVLISIYLEQYILLLMRNQLKYKSPSPVYTVEKKPNRGIYEKNIQAMCTYSNIDEVKFPKYETLSQDYMENIVEDKIAEYLKQVDSDSPITIKNLYDLNIVTWMCNRLRSSVRYGSDNKLYLQYTSFSEFSKILAYQDWSKILDTGKVAFIFDDENMKSCHKDAYSCKTGERMPLAVDEITELIWLKGLKAHSGNLFLDMVLDNHPYLLTLGWLGMSTFWPFYKTFLEGKTVDEALSKLSSTNDFCERLLIKANLQGVFEVGMKKYEKCDAELAYAKSQEKFFKSLRILLQQYSIPSAYVWFKAIYLAGADVLGRKYPSRIAPAILYDYHGFPYLDNSEILFDAYGRDIDLSMQIKEVNNKFLYERCISTVRDPLTICGSYLDWLGDAAGKIDKADIFKCIYSSMMDIFSEFIYRDAEQRKNWGIVRFEDLKLHPYETLQKLSEFLRLPWSDNLLHCTTNGIEKNGDTFNYVGASYGYSQATVYNKHDRYFSWLDRYRLSIIHDEDFEAWGYKSKVKDKMNYTVEELRELFALPFAFEKAFWMPKDVSEKLHYIIADMAIEYYICNSVKYNVPKDNSGQPLFVVRDWIRPQLSEGKILYE